MPSARRRRRSASRARAGFRQGGIDFKRRPAVASGLYDGREEDQFPAQLKASLDRTYSFMDFLFQRFCLMGFHEWQIILKKVHFS